MPQASTETINVAAEQSGQRLDRVLAAGSALSRTRLKALILDGAVTIGARTIRDPGYSVNAGETVAVTVPEPEPSEPAAENIPLNVVFEDEEIIVIDKPAGLVVHPAPGHAAGTLVNALIAHCGDSLSGIGGVKRPGIVHRLDKDTTGLMVVAKNDRAHRHLSKQFADKLESGLQRGYLAVVWGAPDRIKGTIDAALDRSPINREKQAVREGGRDAITHWEMRERYNAQDIKSEGKDAGKNSHLPIASLLACMLETGRTHQIRVHLAHIGHPIIGDETYATGFKTKASRLAAPAQAALAALGRQALHAAVLGFEHPITHEHLRFEAPLPADMSLLVESLRQG